MLRARVSLLSLRVGYAKHGCNWSPRPLPSPSIPKPSVEGCVVKLMSVVSLMNTKQPGLVWLLRLGSPVEHVG